MSYRFHFPGFFDSSHKRLVAQIVRRGWKTDPLSLGIASLVIGAGAGGAALGGAFGKKKSSDGGAAYVAPPAADTTDVGNVTDVGSVETQAASRRLARMSKYFTSPTGVLDTPTGSAGVF